jgi:hypothetical protein
MMSKVIEMNIRKDDVPRATLIREKLDAAEQALAALENDVGPLACDEAEGKPGAAAKMQALNSKIAVAQAERDKLRNAHRYALNDDKRTAVAGAARMREEQFSIFKAKSDKRLALLATMFEALGTAAAAYSKYAVETGEMVVALPTGTNMGILAVGHNGWGGNWVGDLKKLIAGEAFRVAVPDKLGRGARLPFAQAPEFHNRGGVDAIPPAIELMREAHNRILDDISGQMERLNREELAAIGKLEALRETA